MNVIFYVNKNDLDQVDKLSRYAKDGILWKLTEKERYIVECFSDISLIRSTSTNIGTPISYYRQVSIKYDIYNQITEYLEFQ